MSKSARSARLLYAAVAGTAFLALSARTTRAADALWIDPADPTGLGTDMNAAVNLSGNFQDPAHWNLDAVPPTTADLQFNAPGYPAVPYTVTFTQDQTANSVSIANPVTFTMNQFHLILNQDTASASSASLLIANNASLTISNGFVLSQSIQVGSASTATPLASTFLDVDGAVGDAQLLVHSGSTINIYQTLNVTNGGTFDTGDNSLVNMAPDLASGGYNTARIVVDNSYFYMGDGAILRGGAVIFQNNASAIVFGSSLTFDSLYYDNSLDLSGSTFVMNLKTSLLDPHNANAVIPTTITGDVDADIGQFNITSAIVLLTPDSGNSFTPFTIVGNTALTVSNSVLTTGLLNLDGDGAPGTGSTNVLTHSAISVHSDVWIGELGNASVNASNTVFNIDGGLILGDQEGSSGTLVLDGPTSVINLGLNTNNSYYGLGHLIVGNYGSGQMTISGGARVNLAQGWDTNVGLEDNGDGTGGAGTLTITGGSVDASGNTHQSTLNINSGGGGLFAGVYNNSFGVVNITDGGFVYSGDGDIGASSGALGIVNIDGGFNNTVSSVTALSQWLSTGSIYVGDAGIGTLTLSNGAAAETGNSLIIANHTGSTGAVVVSSLASIDIDSNQDESQGLSVGASGAGSLDILTGGGVNVLTNAYIAANPSGSGEITVDGGSVFAVAEELDVGSQGKGTLSITGGGEVASGTAIIGNFAGSAGSAIVDAAEWDTTGLLTIANAGMGTLTIQNAGTVTAGSTALGNATGSFGSILVTGAGSLLAPTGDITIGASGNGFLTIQNAGVISDGGTAYIGYALGANGQVLVTGPGSQLSTTSRLIVGNGGNGTLTIQNGAVVTSGDIIFLGVATGSMGQIIVSGTGSELNGASQMAVGAMGAGTLTVSAGGTVTATAGTSVTHSALAIGQQATGVGVVTITGPGSNLLLTGGMSVGFGNNGSNTTNGGLGFLNVLNAGQVSDANGYIGRYAGSAGIATVAGNGALWANTGGLFIAANDTANNFQNESLAAGVGTLTISAGGSVSSIAPTIIGAAGVLSLQGGVLNTPSVSSSGLITGYGTITGVISGAGTVTAAGPAPLLAGGILANALNVTNSLMLPNLNSSLGTVKVASLLVASNTGGAFTGTLDISTDKLILESTGATGNKATLISTLRSLVTSGKNGGTWTGTGLTSSAVANDTATATTHTYHTTVAIADNGALLTPFTTYGGQPVDASSILVTRALIGDGDLNNTVNNADLVILLNHFGGTGATQTSGDYDGNGTVNNADLVALLNDFGQSLPGGFSLIPNAGAGSSVSTAATAPVPEPASLALLALAGAALLARRRVPKNHIATPPRSAAVYIDARFVATHPPRQLVLRPPLSARPR